MSTESRRLAITAAERLLRPHDVLAALSPSAAASLAHGLAGTALLHARLSATDPLFSSAASTHWAEAALQAKRVGSAQAGVYHSPGGLAASLIIGTPYLPDPDRYRDAVMRAARWTSARAVELAGHYRDYLTAGCTGARWHVYDAISGLAGIGRILLAAVDAGHQFAEPGLLAALSTLTSVIRTRYGRRPGWWLPADQHPSGVNVDPSGAANTGMAHGIAGPLALLAIAQVAGWVVAGQQMAMEEAAHWLLRWRTSNNSTWPPYVSGDELDTDIASPVLGRGDAWCYGIAGVSRSLALAGRAIGNLLLTETADATFSSLAERPAGRWDVEGPTLCHGYAGILQTAAAGNDQASPGQSSVIEGAATAVMAAFGTAHRFAFQHVSDGLVSDDPGFLTGAAGVALALAEHGGLPSPAVRTRWDALLLLS